MPWAWILGVKTLSTGEKVEADQKLKRPGTS